MRKIKLVVPVFKISVETRAVELSLPTPALPKISVRDLVPTRFALASVALHVLLSGALIVADRIEAQNKAKLAAETTPVELEYLAMPESGAGESGEQDTLWLAKKGGKSSKAKQSSLNKLLASAQLDPSKAAKLTKDAQASNAGATESLARRLSNGLLASAIAKTHDGQAYGKVSRAMNIPWDKLAQAKPAAAGAPAISAADRESIRKAIGFKESLLRRCHERALLTDNALSGQANLKINVAASGMISGVDLGFQGTGNAESRAQLQSCVAEALAGIALPRSAGGSEIRFSLLMR